MGGAGDGGSEGPGGGAPGDAGGGRGRGGGGGCGGLGGIEGGGRATRWGSRVASQMATPDGKSKISTHGRQHHGVKHGHSC